jgi:hypothetical protein
MVRKKNMMEEKIELKWSAMGEGKFNEWNV